MEMKNQYKIHLLEFSVAYQPHHLQSLLEISQLVMKNIKLGIHTIMYN
jgi:hypothetical protein